MDAFDCESLGATAVEIDDGREATEHDHGDADTEAVSLLRRGEATVTVDGDAVGLAPGDAVRTATGSTRDFAVSVDGSKPAVTGAP